LVEKGMTIAQVEAILGKYLSCRSTVTLTDCASTRMVWHCGWGLTITLAGTSGKEPRVESVRSQPLTD
jgi:hypothetical protein